MGFFPMNIMEKVLVFVLMCIEKALRIFRGLVKRDSNIS